MNTAILKWVVFSLTAFLVFPASVRSQVASASPSRTSVSGPTGIFTIYDGQPLRRGEWTLPNASEKFDKGFLTYQLESKFLSRTVSYRIIVPQNYFEPNQVKTYYPVVYLLHGLFGHFDNWTDKTSLAEYAAKSRFIIVMPEGADGWYTDSVTIPNDKYESYIIKDLIPEIDKKFRTIADREHRVIAGLSMGGYGSIKFGLKYPELFSLVGSFSGAIDAPLRGQEHKNYRPSIMTVFGPDNAPIRLENDVFTLVKKQTDERLKALPFIYLSCGTEDTVNFQLNRDFAGLLVEKKIPHEYRELPGAHTWAFWDAQVFEFLRLADKLVK